MSDLRVKYADIYVHWKDAVAAETTTDSFAEFILWWLDGEDERWGRG